MPKSTLQQHLETLGRLRDRACNEAQEIQKTKDRIEGLELPFARDKQKRLEAIPSEIEALNYAIAHLKRP